MIIAVRRDSFVVVAADRFETSFDRSDEDTAPKLLLHSALPLTLAVVGLDDIADPRSGRPQSTRSFLERILGEITQPTELVFDRLCARIANRLHPAVRQTLRASGPDSEGRGVDLLIAFVRGTTAGMGVQRIGEGIETREVDRHQDAPPAVGEFLASGAYADPAALYGDKLSDAEFVANHLRRVVEAAGAHDATASAGGQRSIGGAVDVAIVNTRGARLAK